MQVGIPVAYKLRPDDDPDEVETCRPCKLN